jgi:hypothetical protein
MPGYRIYTVGSDGSCIASEDIECADDHEAIKKAAQTAKDSNIELWERGRCIVQLLPAPSPNWNLPAVVLDEPQGASLGSPEVGFSIAGVGS